MKKTIAMLLAAVLLLSLAACGGKAAAEEEASGSLIGALGEKKNRTDSKTSADEPASSRYAQVEWISGGEVFDDEGAALTLYEDGSGRLDLNLYRFGEGYEPDDVVVDPVSSVMYAVDDGTAFPYEVQGGRVLVYKSADSVYVFEPEETGFEIGDIRSDALEALAKSSETFADIAAMMSEDWIHIKTPEDFLHIADDLGGKYILDTDIDDWWDGESTVFTPIGTPEEPFTGELNGNGHTVTGTLAYTGQEEAWGLFGCSEGYIHDLVVGYIDCVEMRDRETEAWDTVRSYDTLDSESLPTESTQYYGVLCGVNRGALENIRFEDRAGVPALDLYPNENDTIYAGVVCAWNEGTISGVHLLGTGLGYHTLDKYTAADLGVICGYQTADAVLEDVSLEQSSVELDTFGEMLNIAPAVNAGLLIGEAESGTTVRGAVSAVQCSVRAYYSLTDADLRLGGLIGRAQGDIGLSDIEISDLSVRIDARTDQEG